MKSIILTGSSGLIGSEAARHWHSRGFKVIGIDNDMRAEFFGPEASTAPTRARLEQELSNYLHQSIDIRDRVAIESLFRDHGSEIAAVIHTAAQPSHDWAARAPHIDFSVNALGTLNLLEATRQFAPEAVFIFTSTNKVYGDRPNTLPLVETDSRWEIAAGHPFEAGIDETMSVDQTTHSLFGASKLSADLLVQEYGRYFNMKTVCFRGGCLTGPSHAGTELHGFLAYLMKCVALEKPYRVFGYGGKQVRDNIHSRDLIAAFWEFFQAPRSGAVYNIGGSRHSNCSMLEAIALSEQIADRKLDWSYIEQNRTGDHIWWISDVSAFKRDYPNWRLEYGIREILTEIHQAVVSAPTH